MSVDNKEVIDFISIDKDNKVVLSISDHLKWDKSEDHQLILQDKINAYLEVVESEQIYEIYPEAKEKDFVIQVVMKFSPKKKDVEFLNSVKEFLIQYNYEFKYYLLDED